MDNKKIGILVRSPNWLGDAVMCLPFLENLRVIYPDAWIGIWCYSNLKDLFKAYQGVDEIIILPKNKFFILKQRSKLKKLFSICILLPNSFSSALISFLAGIPKRIGYDTDGRRLFLTKSYPAPKGIHQIDYFLHLIKCLGYNPKPFTPNLKPLPEGEKEKELLRKKYGWGKEYVIFAPGAAYGLAKCWPPIYFAKLAEKIKKTGKEIILVGSKKDKNITSLILSYLRNQKGIYDIAGKTTLAGVISIIKEASIVISNDSGLMHLTAALRCPQIAIFGPTSPARTSPYGNTTYIIHHPVPCSPCTHRQCPKDHICMKQISVDEVFNIYQKIKTHSYNTL